MGDVSLVVRNADFRDAQFASKRLERLRVDRPALLETFAGGHALTNQSFVDAVDYLGFDGLERAVYERIGVVFGKTAVKEPGEGHRQQERRHHAEDELQV